MRSRAVLAVIVLMLVSWVLADAASVWARAPSGGGRGSRSYSAPARPAPSPVTPANPTSPSRTLTQPTPSQRPGFFGSLMGGIVGFALGGLIGSLLFGGGFGSGIGLVEILLVAVGVFLLMRVIRGRRQEPQPAYAGAGARSSYEAVNPGWRGGDAGDVATEAPPEVADRERGIGHIRQMDQGFDPDAFAGWARTAFTDVQAAITRRDMSALGDRLTPQEYARLQAECDRLRGARQTNRVEQIRIDRAEVTEAWQESGQDWVTVYFAVSLVDCTVDDASGRLVDGSRTPQDIEEYWTFTRPVGANPWRLSAIQTP